MDLVNHLLPIDCYAHQRVLRPQGLIVHYTSGINAWDIYDDLVRDQYDIFDEDLNYRIMQHYCVSAHVFVGRDGRAYQWVPFDRPAWHAGLSILNGKRNCNAWCVGMELASTGKPHNNEPAYTDAQYATAQAIAGELMRENGFGIAWISGHDQVRQAAIDAGLTDKNGKPPWKKHDPGPLFDWGRFLDPFSHE